MSVLRPGAGSERFGQIRGSWELCYILGAGGYFSSVAIRKYLCFADVATEYRQQTAA